jgi:hypothetical protein
VITLAGAVVVGILLALGALSRLDVGTTWWDWRGVEAPRWLDRLAYVLVAMLVLGVGGWFLPGDARAALLGFPAGFCAVPIAIGLRRWVSRGPRPRDVPEPEEPEPPRRPYWQRALIMTVWTMPVWVVIGLLFGLRGGELVAMALAGPPLVLLHDAITNRVNRWLRRHDLE